jgi:CheY-like chemotaxis protein
MMSHRSYLKNVLSRHGFQILEAHDGASAISIKRKFAGRIAALVTDIEMKGMNGIALAKTVTGEFPKIPVLFMTATAISEEDLRRDVPLCVLLQKPFAPKQVVQLLRILLVRTS